MSDSVCDICGSPIGAGGGGDDVAALLAAHLADFGDPHRTLPQVPKSYYGITDPVADSSVYRPGDFFFDLTSGKGYSFRMTVAASSDDPAVYEWTRIINPYTGTIDLSAYLTKAEAASTYVTSDYAAAHFLTMASLSGYVTNGALASALVPYATQSYVSSALSSSGFITQAFADARYQRVAAEGEHFVTASALAAALAAYKPTAELANFLGVANFVTYSYANGNDGYIPKSQADSLNYAKQSWVSSQLANYVPLTGVSTIQASVYSSVMSSVYRDYATKAELAAVAADAGGRLMYSPEKETNVYVLRDHAFNCVELDENASVSESTAVLDLHVQIPPVTTPGLAREFTFVVGFSLDFDYGEIGLTMGVALHPSQSPEDLTAAAYFAVSPAYGTLTHEDDSYGNRLTFESLDTDRLANTLLEFKFVEVAVGKFMVSCSPSWTGSDMTSEEGAE